MLNLILRIFALAFFLDHFGILSDSWGYVIIISVCAVELLILMYGAISKVLGLAKSVTNKKG